MSEHSAEYVADPSAALFEWACCEHCGCKAPEQIGHDDTCRFGCNDPALTDGDVRGGS